MTQYSLKVTLYWPYSWEKPFCKEFVDRYPVITEMKQIYIFIRWFNQCHFIFLIFLTSPLQAPQCVCILTFHCRKLVVNLKTNNATSNLHYLLGSYPILPMSAEVLHRREVERHLNSAKHSDQYHSNIRRIAKIK